MRGWFFLLHTGNCFNVLLYSGCLPCSALTSDTEHAHQKIYIHCDCVSFSSVLLLLLAIQIGFHLLSILGHPPLNHQQPATTTGNKKPSQQYNRRRHCRVPLKRNKKLYRGGVPAPSIPLPFYLPVSISTLAPFTGVPLIHQQQNKIIVTIPERSLLLVLVPRGGAFNHNKVEESSSLRVCLIEQHNEIFILLFYCHVTRPIHSSCFPSDHHPPTTSSSSSLNGNCQFRNKIERLDHRIKNSKVGARWMTRLTGD